MPPPREYDHATPQTALLTTRLVWAVLLAGQGVFLAVILRVWSRGLMPGTRPEVVRLIGMIAIALLITALPLGYYLRNQTYKKHWRGHAISPRGYVSGNLLLFAACEVVVVAGLLAALIGGSLWPWGLPAIVAAAVYAANFPTGHAMREAPPALGE